MAASKSVTIIAKEGYGHIVAAFLPFALAVYGDFSALLTYLFFFLFLYTLFFFRNPERIVADDSIGSVLAPIDGVIEAVERSNDGVRVRIRNGFLDTHIIRSPFKSTVQSFSTRHGMAVIGDFEKAANLNSRCRVHFDEVAMEIVTSFFPYDTVCSVREGEMTRHGERIGFLYTGSLEMVLPNTIELHVTIGDTVKSAENLIGMVKN